MPRMDGLLLFLLFILVWFFVLPRTGVFRFG